MSPQTNVVAVFDTHDAAETAIQRLIAGNIPMQQLGLVGKGFHTEEHVTGFYNLADRVTFWGSRGAFWGGFWGLFLGGVMLTLPVTGPVVILGTIAAAAISAVEGAVVVGGVSALAAALYSLGIKHDSVIAYETAVKADGFLVTATGTDAEVDRARRILATVKPTSMDIHTGTPATPLLPLPV